MYIHTLIFKINIFRKAYTFLKYLHDNFVNREFRLIFYSFKYILTGKTNSKDIVAKTNLGKFYLRKNTIDFKFANSAYEQPVMNTIKKYLPVCDLFVDIGSNIGTYCILANKMNTKSLAFEPTEPNYTVLQKNIKLNNAEDNIRLYNFGLGDKEKTIQFEFNDVNTGASGIPHNNNYKHPIKVNIKPLDDVKPEILSEVSRVLFKIDVEEMELEALEGMKKTIQSIPKLALIIEYKHSGYTKIKEALSNIDSFEFSKIDSFNLLATKNLTN